MRNSCDVIETDNYAILNTLQNFHFRDYSISVYQVELKYTEPNSIGKIVQANISTITKYLNLYWNIVKSFIVIAFRRMLCTQVYLFPLRAVPYGMENSFYLIR